MVLGRKKKNFPTPATKNVYGYLFIYLFISTIEENSWENDGKQMFTGLVVNRKKKN